MSGTGDFRERAMASVRPYYQEPFRTYHGLAHPEEMLAAADALGVGLSRPQVAAVAFHDVVNVAGYPGNEDASAAILRAWAPHLGLDAQETDEAAAIVLATDHSGRPAPASADPVLDLDLMRLAVPYGTFLGHSRVIHAEWRHLVPDERAFMAGRADFLRQFLRRPRIFRAGLFDEGVARNTLSAFVAAWGGAAV